METTGKIRQIELTFILVESLDVPPDHARLHPSRLLDTSRDSRG